MEKVLNQEEIDAMVRAARSGGTDTGTPVQPHVEPWDFRRAGQIGREQLQSITQLHEVFARNLTHSLGAYLRVVFAATLVSAEHLTFREFLQRIPETTYLASCRLNPMAAYAALQLDLKIAFPIIDLLLGGEGKSIAATREITDIEEQILDSVARIVCRELGAAWQALSLEACFEQHLDNAAAQRLMPPEEKVLSLSFEVTMPDIRGGLNLSVPATVSNALLRKMSVDWSHHRPRDGGESRHRLMRQLLNCPFETCLGAKDVQMPVREIRRLAPGNQIAFNRKASDAASLVIEGVEMFHATPARLGAFRAARLLDPISESSRSDAINRRE
ncbi:MAG TPA: FliM/FliN family flagellar motor switch protein [Candidatus Sulfotelmatobacter sp.]|nr:FliM/FliN family flagellar motor switch protein [Candidatus Sulfotelmatobacter sp.]